MLTNTHHKEHNSLITGILGGTLSLTVSTVMVKLLGLIYKIPLASILGDEGMGYFNSAYTVYSFFYLLCTAGVPKAIMLLISEEDGKGREESQYKIMTVAAVSFGALGVMITLAFALLSGSLSHLIGSSAARFGMIAIAPSIIFVSLSGVIRGYLSAHMRMLDVAVSQVIEGAGRLALGLAFAIVGRRINMPLHMVSAMTIWGVSLSSLIGLGYLIVCSKIRIKSDKIGQNCNFREFWSILRRILSISIPITLSAAVMSISGLIDLGLIMRSLRQIGHTEAEASSLYGNYTTLAVPMLNLAISVITPISVAHLPAISRAISSGERGDLISSERSAVGLCAFAAAPMSLGLTVFSHEILQLLFPGSDTRMGGALLCLLCPAILFSSILVIVNTLLEAMGKVRMPLYSMLVGSAVKLAVSYILITGTSFGISGAPIGTTASYATALIISLIAYGRSSEKSLPLLRPLALCYFSAAVSIGLARLLYDRLYFSVDHKPLLLISITFAAVLYIILCLAAGKLRVKNAPKVAKYTKFT